ncbi:MAG: hypothetical protein U0Q11_21770 [Vicinamibacterales bacterium]
MTRVPASHPLVVHVFEGQGSRRNRVHVFDGRTGRYLTRGYTRGSMLFVRRPFGDAEIEIRSFDGRRQTSRRPDATAAPAGLDSSS